MFCETNKEHLSNLYRLEFCLEKALVDYDPKVGKEVIEQFRRIRLFSTEFLIDFISDRTYEYLYSGSVGKMRFRRLPVLLASLDEFSVEYKEFQEYMWKQARLNNTHPVNLFDNREWEDFEW